MGSAYFMTFQPNTKPSATPNAPWLLTTNRIWSRLPVFFVSPELKGCISLERVAPLANP